MLLLFDIDATLIRTDGAGMKAMHDAGRELFGAAFTIDGIKFAGRLDPLILADMLSVNRVAASAETRAAMRRTYRAHLERRLAMGVGRALPGVHALIERLAAQAGVTLGLLTGNFAETGSMKLRACGIDPDRFEVRVWGDHSPHEPPARGHLPPVGMSQYKLLRGRAIEASRVTIIGDTPHDAACAREHSCRCLGVATGQFSVDELSRAGFDRVIADLSDVEDVGAWLTGDPGAPGVTA